MSFYQELKTARAAVIGTIMPWSGPLGGIPKGWYICDGGSLRAADFPLLAQAIGDTYNAGISDFSGAFPQYSGSITLPSLNNKVLMDIEESYFGNTDVGGTGKAIDADPDAKILASSLIGENQDNSIQQIFTDVTTDIVFNLPEGERSGYSGKISGNTAIPGEGTKTVYIGPRKLGRQHVKYHTHRGSIETLGQPYPSFFPGSGVVPYENVAYTLYFQATDNETGSDVGDTWYFGWSTDQAYGQDDADDDGISDSPPGNSDVRPGLVLGTEAGINPGDSGQFATYFSGSAGYSQAVWPMEGSDLVKTGMNDGLPGRVLAKVASEAPPVNLKPQWVHRTPVANIDDFMYKYLDSNTSLPFTPGGGTTGVPLGYRTYYDPGGVTAGTFLSHPGYNFTSNDATDTIIAHTHDDFDVEYDASRLKPRSNIQAVANIPANTVLTNADNRNALQIDFNTTQPTLNCVYIIRAY